MLISAHTSSLLIVDVQERLAPRVLAHNALIEKAQILLKAARRLGIPTLVSEQYPRGLGHTVQELAPLIDGAETLEKIHFSCLGDSTYAEVFRKLGRAQAVIGGMEAHVCVLQTVGDLLRIGTDVFVVADAVSSRTEENYRSGIDRMRAMGAEIVSTEMVLFEWLGRAGTPEFKELSPLIR